MADNLRVWPAGTPLPAGFAAFDWRQFKQYLYLPYCLQRQGAICDVFVIDLGGDARPEVILVGAANHGNAVLRQGDDGAWEFAGALPPGLADCEPLLDAMRAGKLRAVAPAVADLEIDGRRIEINPRHTPFKCGAEPAPIEEDAPR